MATLSENITQVINDLDGIKESANIPDRTPTSEYKKYTSKDTSKEATEWKSHPDWGDIESYVNTGIVPWLDKPLENVRYGFIVTDSNHTIMLPSGYQFYLSDGAYYDTTSVVTHTWDRTKDKPCSDGYMTRAVVVCKSSDRNVSISHRAFLYDGIDSIYVYLGDCNLTSMTFSGSSSSAYNNKLIQAIHITESTTFTGAIITNSFQNCYSLKSIVLPGGITSISTNAFYGCSSLVNIVLPNGITTISSSVFSGCSSLVNIVLPNGITSIGTSTFYGCSSLMSISLPNEVTSISTNAFYGCSSLANILLPSGITSIGSSAFQNCSSLISITLPDKLTSIGNIVFSGCSSLTSISLPSGITSIGSSIFQNCYSLTSVTVQAGFSISLPFDVTNCINLSITSSENIIHNYANMTGKTSPTLTIGPTNLAKLSEKIIAEATAKNITLA